MPLSVPPVRERMKDIPFLTEHVLRVIEKELGRERMVISPDVFRAFMNYSWPGNVRELQNVVKYAVVKCKDQLIEIKHLPPMFTLPDVKRSRKRKLTSFSVNKALAGNGGNKVKAARTLGVSRATLYRFIDDMKSLQ